MPATQQFLASEDGAVTIDWVVLTSVVIVVAMATGYMVRGQLSAPSSQIAAQVEEGILPR